MPLGVVVALPDRFRMRGNMSTPNHRYNGYSVAQRSAQGSHSETLNMPRGLDATCAAVRRESPELALLVDGDGHAIGLVDVERGSDVEDVPPAGFVS